MASQFALESPHTSPIGAVESVHTIQDNSGQTIRDVPSADFRAYASAQSDVLRQTISLDELEAAGLDADPMEYDFVYGYPPLQGLPVVNNADIVRLAKPAKTLAVYVHLPFCSYACSFCYFSKRIQPGGAFVEDYLKILAKEICNAARWASDSRITSVYFGGGTPTYLRTEQLERLIDQVASCFNLADEYEWTVEASPETINLSKAKRLVAAGVNRISLGIQSFDQVRVNEQSRDHTTNESIRAVCAIRQSGVPRHNVDLIFGYPGQTLDDLWCEFDLISYLDLRSVTWYQLWQQMDTPLRRASLSSHTVTPEHMLALKCLLRTTMAEMGFVRDKVDWFVRDLTDAQRQQEHKWSGGDFLGLGLSAYGYLDGVYYQNDASAVGYRESIHKNGFGIRRGAKLDLDRVVRRKVMLGMKRLSGVPSDLLSEGSTNLKCELTQRLNALVNVRLVERSDNSLRLTELGRMFGDGVANALGLTAEDWRLIKKLRRHDRVI